MNIPIENEPAFGMAAGAGRPAKRTGAFTDEELIAAHELSWPDDGDDGFTDIRIRHALSFGWDRSTDPSALVFLLALGVLPEGWGIHLGLYQFDWEENGSVRMELNPSCDEIWCNGWPEAVRSGQADIACRLMAAHVELERRRMEKGIVDVR